MHVFPPPLASSIGRLPRILALARAQRPDPEGWSLAVDADWLQRAYFGAGVATMFQALPSGELGGCASVRIPDHAEPPVVTVTSMLRPGCEHHWKAQLGWIESRLQEAGIRRVRVISECLADAETARWTAAGYDLVFEELAMECDLTEPIDPPARWAEGTTILEWNGEAADLSFEVYEAAFAERPGFPGWSRSEWIDRLTGDPDFMPGASFCVLRDGQPAGFVVCSNGWVDQVGVTPAHRRLGLASALVTEAGARMHRLGMGVAQLHVNANNSRALAAWRRLGWRESGRRGRFERAVTAHPRANGRSAGIVAAPGLDST